MATRRTWRRDEFPVRYGKYELLGRIAFGGMAEVLRARILEPEGVDRVVAIKRILPHLAETPEMMRLFIEEAKLSARAQHKNVVQVYELERTESGELYLVMELVKGVDLQALLVRAAQLKLRIPVWFSVHVMCEALSGLVFVHELKDDHGNPLKVVHRDMSPDNIFVTMDGQVKIGDFGVAKSAVSPALTRVGALKGKLEYASPEQIRSGPIDQRVDVFGAAVVLWELLTQRALFGGRPEYEISEMIMSDAPRPAPSQYFKEIPAVLDRCVLRALSVDPADRHQTSRELLQDLLQIRSSLRDGIRSSDVEQAFGKLLGADASTMIPPPKPISDMTTDVGTSADDPSEAGTEDLSDEEQTLITEQEASVTIAEPVPVDVARNEDVWVELSAFAFEGTETVSDSGVIRELTHAQDPAEQAAHAAIDLGPSVLEQVMRTMSLQDLEGLVAQYKNAELAFSRRFLDAVHHYGLTAAQHKLLRAIALGQRAQAVLGPGREPLKEQLALLHVFIDGGLLLVKRSPARVTGEIPIRAALEALRSR
jgi:serine/threonine protein kinase